MYSKIPVIFSSDDNYAPFLGVAISSMLNSRFDNTYYDIHIINSGISERNIEKFCNLGAISSNCKVTILNPDKDFCDLQLRCNASSQAYFFRFLAAELLRNYNKCLYLDCDILILGDLGELFNIDLSDKLAAVVRDELVYKRSLDSSLHYDYYYDHLSYTKEQMKDYFNSGMMLLNLDMYRELNVSEKLRDFYQTKKNIFFKDQDALNWCFRGRTIVVEDAWNLSQNKIESFLDDKNFNDAKIIHFTAIRPWELFSLKQRNREKVLAEFYTLTTKDKEKHRARIQYLSKLWFNVSKKTLWPNSYFEYKQKFDLERSYLPISKEKSRTYFFVKSFLNKILSIIPDANRREKLVSIILLTYTSIRPWLNGIRLGKEILLKYISSLLYKIYLRSCSFSNDFGLNYTEKREKLIIVSLTTIPARINDVKYTLFSILNQHLKPDKIVLWIDAKCYSNLNIPSDIKKLEDFGVDIRYTEDIGPATKLIPSLKLYPNEIIVTADDDILYRRNWLEKLYSAYLKEPRYIYCHRARFVLPDRPYDEWVVLEKCSKPSKKNFLTGVGGVLYPPKCFDEEVLNIESMLNLSPKADDIWFYCMAIKNNCLIANVEEPNVKLIYTDPLEEFVFCRNTLSTLNVKNDQNEIQFKAVLAKYKLRDYLLE